MARSVTQDLEPAPVGGGRRLRRGPGPERLPAWGARARRPGRQSPALRCPGSPRPVLPLRGSPRGVEAGAPPATHPAHEGLETFWPSLAAQGPVQALSLERASRQSPWRGARRAQGRALIAQPWPWRNRGRCTNDALQSTRARHEVTCPAGVTGRRQGAGRRAPCPAETCGRCLWQAACTPATRGRPLRSQPQEARWREWRATRRPVEGRQALRQRTVGQPPVARLDQLQGQRARCKGTRHNTLALRRTAAVTHLQPLHGGQALERVA